MDRPLLIGLRCLDLIDRITENIEQSAQCVLADRHGNRCAGCDGIHATDKSIRWSQSNTSYCIITQMLSNLYNQPAAVFQRNIDCFVNLRQITFLEFDIQNGTDNLSNFTNIITCHLFSPYFLH